MKADEGEGDFVMVGDLIKWSWHLSTDWAQTHFTGIVIDTIMYKTDYEKIRVLKVFDNTGQAVTVRDDEASLEIIKIGASQ